MKHIIYIYILININIVTGYAQDNYPEPAKTDVRLFYIQHSNNHNTYVYDVNLTGKKINKQNPIKDYRILYSENGTKKPLTSLQKKLAYGIVLKDLQPNLFKFQLAAFEDLNFYLTYYKNKGARVYVTINNQKLFLDKLFVKLKDGFLGTSIKADYVLFYGVDFKSGKQVIEKFVL